MAARPDKQLTIRFFTSFVHPQGTYFRFHNLARELAVRGHTVVVHGADQEWRSSDRTEIRDGVEYQIVSESRPVAVLAAPMHPVTALRRARGVPANCDVAHLFQPFLSALGAWRRTRAAVHVYDWDELWAGGLFPPRRVAERPGVAALLVLERALARYSRHTTVAGQWLADKARAWGARGTVQIVHNGFTPRPLHDKAQARAELGLEPEGLYLGFIGRTTPQVEWCFEALRQAAPRWPSLRMAIAGLPKQLVDAAPDGVRARIDYLGDLSPERAAMCADAIDIGLLPMRDDTWNRSRFPIKFADYLSAGLYVVCSSVGECGRLAQMFDQVVPAGTTSEEWMAAVERAVSRCSEHPGPERPDQGAVSRLSWPSIAEDLEAYYLRILRARSATSPLSPCRPARLD